MGEVRAQLQEVYNSGFRDEWKPALRKADIPNSSDLYLRSNMPLPYPEAGLKRMRLRKRMRLKKLKLSKKTG
jgi:hypothetical protein